MNTPSRKSLATLGMFVGAVPLAIGLGGITAAGASSGEAFLKDAHKNVSFDSFQYEDDCAGSDAYGWHFVLPPRGERGDFEEVSITFNSGVVTDFVYGANENQVFVYTSGPATLVDGSATVTNTSEDGDHPTEFVLSHVCGGTEDEVVPEEDDTTTTTVVVPEEDDTTTTTVVEDDDDTTTTTVVEDDEVTPEVTPEDTAPENTTPEENDTEVLDEVVTAPTPEVAPEQTEDAQVLGESTENESTPVADTTTDDDTEVLGEQTVNELSTLPRTGVSSTSLLAIIGGALIMLGSFALRTEQRFGTLR